MNLYIAEKPSVAKDIAKALGGDFQKKDGYLESADNVVTWCYGHLLKSIEPEAYNPDYAQWKAEDLQLIEGEGFTPEELLGDGVNISKTRRKTPKAPAKYEFVENGETKTWTGKERKPKPIAEALSAGRTLDEFLINKSEIQ